MSKVADRFHAKMSDNTKRVYIASGFENVPAVRELAGRLPFGWEWSYDWTNHTFDDDPAEVAAADRAGVMSSDVVIVLLPGGPGCHTEMGMAIGAHKPLCVVGDAPRKDPRWPRCPFYLLGDRVPDADAAVEWLRADLADITKERDALLYRMQEIGAARDAARVEAIEARHKADERTSHAMGGANKARNARDQLKKQDRCIEKLKADLVKDRAEVERLKVRDANITQLKDIADVYKARAEKAEAERDQARADLVERERCHTHVCEMYQERSLERDALKATVEKLKADLASVQDKEKKFRQGIMNNAPRCGACAEGLFTGGIFNRHDDDCPIATVSRLTEELETARGALTIAESALQERRDNLEARRKCSCDPPCFDCCNRFELSAHSMNAALDSICAVAALLKEKGK